MYKGNYNHKDISQGFGLSEFVYTPRPRNQQYNYKAQQSQRRENPNNRSTQIYEKPTIRKFDRIKTDISDIEEVNQSLTARLPSQFQFPSILDELRLSDVSTILKKKPLIYKNQPDEESFVDNTNQSKSQLFSPALLGEINGAEYLGEEKSQKLTLLVSISQIQNVQSIQISKMMYIQFKLQDSTLNALYVDTSLFQKRLSQSRKTVGEYLDHNQCVLVKVRQQSLKQVLYKQKTDQLQQIPKFKATLFELKLLTASDFDWLLIVDKIILQVTCICQLKFQPHLELTLYQDVGVPRMEDKKRIYAQVQIDRETFQYQCQGCYHESVIVPEQVLMQYQ